MLQIGEVLMHPGQMMVSLIDSKDSLEQVMVASAASISFLILVTVALMGALNW